MKKRYDDSDIENIREKIFPSLRDNSVKENTSIRKLSEKHDKRALARQYRKAGKIVSLSADLSENIESMNASVSGIEKLLSSAVSDIDKAKTGFIETGKLYSDISSPIENIRGAVSETSYTISDLYKSVSKFKKTLTDTAVEFNNQITTDLLTYSPEDLKGYITELGAISSGIAAVADKIDILGINSSLDAGKSGESGAFFALIGSSLQKSVRPLEWNAKEFDAEVTGIITSITHSAESAVSVSDKKADIKNLIETFSGRLYGIIDGLNGINMTMEEITDKIDMAASGSAQLSSRDTLWKELEKTLQASLSASEGNLSQRKLLGAVSELENKLSDLPSKILPEQENTSILDCICDISDELNMVFEKIGDGLEITANEIDNASRLSSAFEKDLSSEAGIYSEFIIKIEEASVKAHEAETALESILESISLSVSESGLILSGLKALKKENDNTSYILNKIDNIIERVNRISFQIESLAGKIELIALISQAELLRTASVRPGFANLPSELGNISRTLNDLSIEISALGQKIKKSSITWQNRTVQDSAESLLFRIQAVQEGFQEINSMDYSPSENILLLIKLLDELKKNRIRASEKMVESLELFRTASQNIENGFGFAAKVKKTLESSMICISEINSAAIEFYPDEQ